jgi:hypothetical protein
MKFKVVPSITPVRPSAPEIKLTRFQAYQAASDADKAFTIELVRCFGSDAASARYQPRGTGEEGSALRTLSDAKIAADKAWSGAVFDS